MGRRRGIQGASSGATSVPRSAKGKKEQPKHATISRVWLHSSPDVELVSETKGLVLVKRPDNAVSDVTFADKELVLNVRDQRAKRIFSVMFGLPVHRMQPLHNGQNIRAGDTIVAIRFSATGLRDVHQPWSREDIAGPGSFRYDVYDVVAE